MTTCSDQTPIDFTLAMRNPRVRRTYASFNAKQTRTILEGLGVEPPDRLPNARSKWLCQFPNLHALIWGCLSISVSQVERVNNKPQYQIEVERFADFAEAAVLVDLKKSSAAQK